MCHYRVLHTDIYNGESNISSLHYYLRTVIMGKRNNARKAAHWDNQSVLGSMWGNLNLPEMRQSLRINQYIKLFQKFGISPFKWINPPPDIY